MQTIKTVYDSEGILNESFDEFDGKIEINYFPRSEDFEKGVLVFLGDYTHLDSCFDKLEDLTQSDDWFFDIKLKNIETDKKYLVNLEGYWDYGIFIAVDDIEEFISGIASCPKAVMGKITGGQLQNWKEIKYLEFERLNIVKGKDYWDYFTLSTEILDINVESVEINIF